jgi:hypothetical protein
MRAEINIHVFMLSSPTLTCRVSPSRRPLTHRQCSCPSQVYLLTVDIHPCITQILLLLFVLPSGPGVAFFFNFTFKSPAPFLQVSPHHSQTQQEPLQRLLSAKQPVLAPQQGIWLHAPSSPHPMDTVPIRWCSLRNSYACRIM